MFLKKVNGRWRCSNFADTIVAFGKTPDEACANYKDMKNTLLALA